MIRREQFTEDHRNILEAAKALGFCPINVRTYQASDEAIVEFALQVAAATAAQAAASPEEVANMRAAACPVCGAYPHNRCARGPKQLWCPR